jgi:hypothetical protein
MPFSNTWNALHDNLLKGTDIPNWTVHSGNIGESFRVTIISDKFIEVDAPGAKALQRVPRDDFEEIYDRWDDYNRRGLARSEFSTLTRYSKYIISILHWLEEHTEARRLP